MEQTKTNKPQNIIRIDIYGFEDEFFAVDSDGEEGCGSYGGLDTIRSMTINGEDIEHKGINRIISDEIREFNLEDDTESEIVGIRDYENKSHYYAEIEADTFDINKLTLVFRRERLVIDSENSFTPDMDFLDKVIYDGKEYLIEFEESRGVGSDIIWGIDPDDEDYEDDEDWDEEED